MVGRSRPGRPPFSRRFGIRAGKSSLRIYFGVLPNMASFSTWASNRPNPCGTKYPVRLRKPPTQTCIPEGSRQDPGSGAFSRVPTIRFRCFSISLVSAPMDTARSISMSPQIRRQNGPPSDCATRFGSIGCGRCGIAWLPLERRIRRRLLRGRSRVGLQKGRQECADGREQ
jgi:hypothetical protein